MLRNRGKRTSSLYGYRRKLKTNLHENVRKSRLTREKQRLLQDEEGVISFEKPVVLPDAVSNFLDVNGEPENFYADDTAYYVLLSDHPRVSIRNPKRYLCFAGHRLLQGAPLFLKRLRSNMESSIIRTLAWSSESSGIMASLMILEERIVVKRIQLIWIIFTK